MLTLTRTRVAPEEGQGRMQLTQNTPGQWGEGSLGLIKGQQGWDAVTKVRAQGQMHSASVQ